MSMANDFIDVFYGQLEFTNFGAMLFRLIAKADKENLLKLEKAFPSHVYLYRWWMGSKEAPSLQEVVSYAEFLENKNHERA